MSDNLPSIMSIRELIDTAFGEPSINVVNHKLIQTILIILARQLRLLERRVEVEIGPSFDLPSGTSLSVTEVKLHANVPRKKKGKGGAGGSGGAAAGGAGGPGARATKSKTGMREETLIPSSAKVTSKASAVSYDKTSSFGTKSTTDKSSSDKTQTSTEKSSSGFTSSTTKSTTDKSSSLKTSSDKTSSDKTSTEKTSSGKTSSDKTSTEKTSTDKSTTETAKSSSDKKTSDETKSSTDRTSTLQITSSPTKRTDSREERDKTPTPMASIDAMEKQYEKLLIVERVPTDGLKAAESRSQAGLSGKTPRLSVVTQEEFSQLAGLVRQLQDKFKIAGAPGFPENAQLMDDLRKGASLTDAMAALQLSARVEAAEKALEKMTSLVTDLASKTPGINLQELLAKGTSTDEEAAEASATSTASATAQTAQSQAAMGRQKSVAKEVASKSTVQKKPKKASSKESLGAMSTISKMSEMQVDLEGEEATVQEAPPEEPKEPPDTVNYEELDTALQEIYDECIKIVTSATARSNTNANNALKIAQKLEGKLDESLNLGDRMFDLEKIFSEYAEKINTLDTGLSSQMTSYQEQLTQMQHDLESGLEAMAEALANQGGDTAAVAELNNHFTNLQSDIDVASTRQKELRDLQVALSIDLQALWKQIEILRDTKSDRDEVADALRDKAGLGALNGLVSRQEFDAVRGDFEKRIGSAYDKFNNQEIVWQKAIDDLIRELNEKADWVQVVSLQGSINQYLEKYRERIRAIEEVVGEPRAASVSRKLHRDAECLSCATPAHMDLEEGQTVPMLPSFPSSRPPTIGAEAKSKHKEDGIHRGVCYPGLQVPHVVDPRAHVCHRYCGGSHTMINNTLSRGPVGMIINPAMRQVRTAVGTDGKIYMVDEVKKPCIPCNYKKTTTPEPSESEPAPNRESFVSDDLTTYDFAQQPLMQAAEEVVSVTPPPPMDDD